MEIDGRSSRFSLLKPNGQKNMGAHDKISSDPAISRHDLPKGVG
jgi:hypothetical protein